LFEGMLSAFVGVPGGRCADVDPAAARAQLARESGPDRLIDLMVRSGPYGDRFDDDAAGLAVDLGPLEPRLPDVLKTPGRRIPLAHELFVRDVPRLRAKLAQSADARTLLLVGRRQLRNMNSWLHNVDLLARGR